MRWVRQLALQPLFARLKEGGDDGWMEEESGEWRKMHKVLRTDEEAGHIVVIRGSSSVVTATAGGECWTR